MNTDSTPACSEVQLWLMRVLCYVVNGLQNHTPNPYKIAFSSFTIRVNLLLKCVADQKQTVNLGIGSGSRVCQTVYEKVVC